nr:YitT family protein [Anaerobacillus isosaccharinicus]QOY38590.1 YitT family protein [Anaerobacillus isosaccharinicus]
MFKSKKGDFPITRQQAYRIINKVAKEVGIDSKIGTHTLRKTFGYHAYRGGIAVSLLQQIFHHSSKGETMKKFIVRTLYANVITSVALIYLAPFAAITSSEVLIVLYGGVLLGLGIGLVVKAGGAIDGSEMLAVWMNKKYSIPISKFLLVINAFIFIMAAMVFTLEKAMFSVAIFFIVTKVIDFVLDGINQGKSIMIISTKPEEIGQKLVDELGISITYLNGTGGYKGDDIRLIYCITDRFMYPKLKDLVLSIDKFAILEASFVTETTGVQKNSLLK